MVHMSHPHVTLSGTAQIHNAARWASAQAGCRGWPDKKRPDPNTFDIAQTRSLANLLHLLRGRFAPRRDRGCFDE